MLTRLDVIGPCVPGADDDVRSVGVLDIDSVTSVAVLARELLLDVILTDWPVLVYARVLGRVILPVDVEDPRRR